MRMCICPRQQSDRHKHMSKNITDYGDQPLRNSAVYVLTSCRLLPRYSGQDGTGKAQRLHRSRLLALTFSYNRTISGARVEASAKRRTREKTRRELADGTRRFTGRKLCEESKRSRRESRIGPPPHALPVLGLTFA